ncbi:MAG: DUF1854 domain-containing protein, partial [Planctomycetaceae bacterium]
QVTKQPTVDTLRAGDDEPAAAEPGPQPSASGIEWLDPAVHRFVPGPHGRIDLMDGGERRAAGVFVIRVFPASHPEAYLSVRGWNETGEEVEFGMIRSLADWPAADREVVQTALGRRALVREITRVHGVRLAHGYLDFDVDTAAGRRTFTTRWTQAQASDFGSGGKLLIDADDNRWLVRRVDDLPSADRERFLHYVYW